MTVDLKPASEYAVIGTPQSRLDARKAVTGKKQYTLDLEVPDAKPTMICRAPTLNGKPKAIRNQAAVEAMPGITDVALVPTGVAVRGETFGQCIDAVRALDVAWLDGHVGRAVRRDVLAKAQGRRGPAGRPEARSAHQERRGRLHVLVPLQQLPGAERRHRRRAGGQAPRSGAPARTRSPPPRRSRPCWACRRRPSPSTSSRAAAPSAASCSTTRRSRRRSAPRRSASRCG